MVANKQPQPSSKKRLAQLLLCQQQQIKQVLKMLVELDARIGRVEVQLNQLVHFVESAEAETQIEKEKAVRDALRHLDDVNYLSGCDLAQILTEQQGRSPGGESLRSTLIQAIQNMQPREQSPSFFPEHRYWDVLYLTYVRKKNAEEVASSLSISRRQYFRDLRAAIQRVTEQTLGT